MNGLNGGLLWHPFFGAGVVIDGEAVKVGALNAAGDGSCLAAAGFENLGPGAADFTGWRLVGHLRISLRFAL
jgi:hypothetical protein